MAGITYYLHTICNNSFLGINLCGDSHTEFPMLNVAIVVFNLLQYRNQFTEA